MEKQISQGETSQHILGAERIQRGRDTMAAMVGVCTLNGLDGRSVQVLLGQQALYAGLLEKRIEQAKGFRRNTLLQAYDLMLEARELFVVTAPKLPENSAFGSEALQ